MVVCHCKGLTDRDVCGAIAAGACSGPELARQCGAGSVCGGCRPLLDELLDRHEAASDTGPRFELAAAS
jgi:bacterioferritin-associated ferredoxin